MLTRRNLAADAEQWVQNRNAEGTKRLTMGIPASLHLRMNIACVMKDITIAD